MLVSRLKGEGLVLVVVVDAPARLRVASTSGREFSVAFDSIQCRDRGCYLMLAAGQRGRDVRIRYRGFYLLDQLFMIDL